LGAAELVAVDGHDDVAVLRNVLLPLEADLVVSRLQACVVGRAPALYVDDQGALAGVDPETLGKLRVEGTAGDAEEAVVDLALVAKLSQRALDGVDRDRVPDSLAAAGGGPDLGVDSEHPALAVEQRPPG